MDGYAANFKIHTDNQEYSAICYNM